AGGEARTYRAIGIEKATKLGEIRINLLARRGERFHVDQLDVYAARQRLAFITHAAAELEIEPELVKQDVAKVLRTLEEIQEKEIQKTKAPKARAVELTVERKRAAMALLQDPRLMERIHEAFAICGVVGEEVNRMTAFLVAISRK